MAFFNDPIAQLLTHIRNAQGAQHLFVDLDLSKMRQEIVELLYKQGYIAKYLVDPENHRMRIFLKYNKKREPVIQGLKRVSSPGLRRYAGYRDVPRVKNGIGMAIVSTPKGIMDDKTAREMKLGGEILCFIW